MTTPIPSAPPRFFLRAGPEPGPAELEPEEVDHVLRVLRLAPGDELVGLDGRGAAWPLALRTAARGRIELEPAGLPHREPPPGAPGAPLPWIEVAVAFPRTARAEEMVDRLVQLGAAAIRPLVCVRSHPSRRENAALGGRRARLERIVRSACKQAGRLWLPELGEPAALATWLDGHGGATRIHLDPRAERTLPDVLAGALGDGAARATRERPLALVVGPEGGLAPAELEALDAAGTARARLGPHVLRVATAAEAAMAVAAAWFAAPTT